VLSFPHYGQFDHEVGWNSASKVQNTVVSSAFSARTERIVKGTVVSTQLRFPWAPQLFERNSLPRRVRRSRIRHLRWPPQIGEEIAFWTDFGIEMGVLREIRQGLACPEYHITDGRIAMAHELMMGSDTTLWRDPDTVSEQERKACAARINAAHDADPEKDLRLIPEAWADFCQYMAHTAVRNAKKDERRKLMLMEIKPNIPPA